MDNSQYEEKVREWERKIEDILVEMVQVTAENGLAFRTPDHIALIKEFTCLTDDLRESLHYANANPGKASLVIPLDAHLNEE